MFTNLYQLRLSVAIGYGCQSIKCTCENQVHVLCFLPTFLKFGRVSVEDLAYCSGDLLKYFSLFCLDILFNENDSVQLVTAKM